jgi:hypothetical protein
MYLSRNTKRERTGGNWEMIGGYGGVRCNKGISRNEIKLSKGMKGEFRCKTLVMEGNKLVTWKKFGIYVQGEIDGLGMTTGRIRTKEYNSCFEVVMGVWDETKEVGDNKKWKFRGKKLGYEGK